MHGPPPSVVFHKLLPLKLTHVEGIVLPTHLATPLATHLYTHLGSKLVRIVKAVVVFNEDVWLPPLGGGLPLLVPLHLGKHLLVELRIAVLLSKVQILHVPGKVLPSVIFFRGKVFGRLSAIFLLLFVLQVLVVETLRLHSYVLDPNILANIQRAVASA